MVQTPNFGFQAVDPADQTSNVLDVMQATNGSVNTSNIMRIDALLKELQDKESFRVVESAQEPAGLKTGDEWDCLLGEVT